MDSEHQVIQHAASKRTFSAPKKPLSASEEAASKHITVPSQQGWKLTEKSSQTQGWLLLKSYQPCSKSARPGKICITIKFHEFTMFRPFLCFSLFCVRVRVGFEPLKLQNKQKKIFIEYIFPLTFHN